MERGRSWRKRATASIAAAGLGIAGLMAMGAAESVPSLTPPPAEVQKSLDHAGSLSTAFRFASENVLPSVVMIQTTSGPVQMTRGERPRGPREGLPDELLENPLLREFFRDLPDMQPQQPRIPQRSGMGSGVIIDEEGIILTNNHVVSGAGKVMVRLHDGRQFEATEVHTDPKTDLAVIRIEGASGLQAATLGDSERLQIGDWVLAVGSPFGLRETVTAGIISAKARGLGITEREDFLQTDAAINPGNSGGPLVNLKGEVVGINTAISSTNGGYQGVGFAIPINLAKWVSKQLIENGHVERALLGVGIQEVTLPLAEQLGLKKPVGVVVTEVRPGSSAAKAGFRSGDVIVRFDDERIKTPRELQGLVEQAGVGSSHKVEVLRGDDHVELDVTLQAMPTELAGKSSWGSGQQQPAEFEQLGMEVRNLTAEIAQQLELSAAEGVVITQVAPGGPAATAGLQPGMVIARVGQETIHNVDDFRAAVKDASVADGVLLLVRSAQGSRFVVIKP